jgi:hypothetical protein
MNGPRLRKDTSNGIAVQFKLAAYIILIIGFFGGLSFILDNGSLAIGVWIGAFSAALSCLGISEGIQLLHTIALNTQRSADLAEKAGTKKSETESTNYSDLPRL